MHVMHIIDSMHGGGAETSILEIVPGLASRGVKTSIVTLVPDDGGLDGRLVSLGITCIKLNSRRPLGAVLKLRGIVRAENPRLLHTTLLFSNLAGRVAARATHKPVVTTLANLDYGPEHRANSRYGAWAVRSAYCAELITAPLTRRFHAISDDVAKVMGPRLRIPTDQIQVVYRGRDPGRLGVYSTERRLRVRKALSIDAAAPVVLSVARQDQQKGVDTTIEAFRGLITAVPDAVLLVVGRPGNATTVIRAAAADVPGIRLLGHRNDVPDLMCAADVLSFPSRWEGLGGTLIEAMALRLGVVASDIAPVAEAMGDAGWPLVPADNPRALAGQLASVLRDNAVNDARKDKGVQRFRMLFTAEAASAGMADFYHQTLDDSDRSPRIHSG
jgi:glycosyltransferase involved in cell wall biosynthesis